MSWSPSPNDGGSPVTGYTITPRVGAFSEASIPHNSPTTTQTVSGLTNGTPYSFTVTATNNAGTSAPSSPSATVTPFAPSSVRLVNRTGTVGRLDTGDQVIVTFSAPPAANRFCSSWTATSHGDLSGPNVYAAAQQQPSGNDTFSIFDSAPSDCGGVFNFGWIDLGQGGYVTGTVIFNDSSIRWDGDNTLTITLGPPDIAVGTQTDPSVAIYHPDPALGLAGTINSPDETHF